MHPLIRNAAGLTLDNRLTFEEASKMLHYLLGALQVAYLTDESIAQAIDRARDSAIGRPTTPCTPSTPSACSTTTPPTDAGSPSIVSPEDAAPATSQPIAG